MPIVLFGIYNLNKIEMFSKRMSWIKRLKIVNKYPIKPLRLSQQECKALWDRIQKTLQTT
jgi:hypothetical protein